MAHAYSPMQATPFFHNAHRIILLELADERLPMLFSERCDATAHTLWSLSRQSLYPNCASQVWRDMAGKSSLTLITLWPGVVHIN